MSFTVKHKSDLSYNCVCFNGDYNDLLSFLNEINNHTDIHGQTVNRVSISFDDPHGIKAVIIINDIPYTAYMGYYILNANGEIKIYNKKEFHEKYECLTEGDI